MKTLREFYEIMGHTKTVRQAMTRRYLADASTDPEGLAQLEQALVTLEGIPRVNDRRELLLDEDRTMGLDLGYEISELGKDLVFFKEGEQALSVLMRSLHPGFDEHLERGVGFLEERVFNNFVTDRDGTINNYCGRYRSSIQSAYNAVFLSRFIWTRTKHAVVITSAPLANPGIVDVSVMPPKTFIYAASKAREFIDASGNHRTFPVDPGQQAKLTELNRRLVRLTETPGFEQYALIGSGLQFKFGETTVARQDISVTIPPPESEAFLERVRKLVAELDPRGTDFAIGDTGLDIEIVLKLEGAGGEAPSREFDKCDGLLFLAEELGLDLSVGPTLVCGNTSSDLRLVEACLGQTDDVRTIFVTQDEGLAARVSGLCPRTLILPQTDMLVSLLDRLAQEGRENDR